MLASLQNKSHIMLSAPFASDAPNAAAYSSASALLLTMISCLHVVAFKRCRFNLAKLCCGRSAILWHSLFTATVMCALSWLKNKHLNTCDLHVLIRSGSNCTGFSSFASSTIGVCNVFPFSSPRLSMRTSTCRGHVGTISLSLSNIFSGSRP